MGVTDFFVDASMYDNIMNGNGSRGPSARQSGAVLLIALVVLIAMTLSALALIKSVNTTNLVAGNLAFRESAVLYAERATEYAIRWLRANSGGAVLHQNGADGSGYLAVRRDPAIDQSWDNLWRTALVNSAVSVPIVGSGDTDLSGNRVSYVIQRLCKKTGPVDVFECSVSPLDSGGSSHVSGSGSPLLDDFYVYYRITARVAGSRNTNVYTQTIVAGPVQDSP
jgi:Tfp pilus assembly protein PilX